MALTFLFRGACANQTNLYSKFLTCEVRLAHGRYRTPSDPWRPCAKPQWIYRQWFQESYQVPDLELEGTKGKNTKGTMFLGMTSNQNIITTDAW